MYIYFLSSCIFIIIYIHNIKENVDITNNEIEKKDIDVEYERPMSNVKKFKYN